MLLLGETASLARGFAVGIIVNVAAFFVATYGFYGGVFVYGTESTPLPVAIVRACARRRGRDSGGLVRCVPAHFGSQACAVAPAPNRRCYSAR